MKSILTFILATFLLFPLQAQEKVYTVDNLPKVHLNPEKPDVPLNKNDAFQKVQKRRVQEKR